MTPYPMKSEVWLPLLVLLALCAPVALAWTSPELELAWSMLSSLCG